MLTTIKSALAQSLRRPGIGGDLMLTYILIGDIFVIKYLSRVSVGLAMAGAVLYTLAAWVLLNIRPRDVSTKTLTAATVAYAAIFAAIQCMIDPNTVNVDRWSALHNDIDYLLQGKYPYMAQTHLDGYASPFPVWQVVHIPFFLMGGHVGLSIFAGLGLWVWSVRKAWGTDAAMTGLILMACSPSLAYEVSVWSDLVTNFLVVSAVINILIWKQKELSRDTLWMYVAVLGLLMSTRLSVALPFFVMLLMPFWRLPHWGKVVFVVGIAGVFALTFVPYLIWDAQNLLGFKYGPFALQTAHTNNWWSLMTVPIVIYLALKWRGETYQLMRNIAMSVFAVVALTPIIGEAVKEGYEWMEFDIAYFDMAMPFIAVAMAHRATHPTNEKTFGAANGQ